MNNFREAFSQIRAQCESSEFRTGITQLRRTFQDKPLILYGAGELGTRKAKWLSSHDIHAECFCDRAKTGTHSETNLPIISPQELVATYSKANILVCSIAHAEQIQQDLFKLGFPNDQIYLTEGLNIHSMTLNDFLPYVDGYEWAYHFFEDEPSRKVILNRIEGYLLSSPLPASTGVMYFDKHIMNLHTEEVFVDGGVFTGDTALEFLQQVQGKFRKYYGFEIDEENYKQAAQNLRGIERTVLVKKGLWSCDTELRIQDNLAASSKISESGNVTIKATGLDAFFAAMPDQPTLIKLDIEGAEREALIGAENIIKLVKPKLAVCAYHKPEDIYDLPRLLDGYDVGYTFTLRHYSDSLLDTVLYAV